MKPNELRLKELAGLIRNTPHRVVPFIGAGCSAPFGIPTWPRLLERLADSAASDCRLLPEQEQRIRDLIAGGKMFQAADLLIAAFGGRESRALLLELRTACRPTKEVQDSILHRLHFLGARVVVTTNYDTIIEDLWYSVRQLPRLRVTVELSGSALSPPPDQAWLVKLHGDIDTPGSLILGQSDYDDLLRRPHYRGQLDNLLSTKSALFLGFGMTDFDLDLVFETSQLRAGKGGPHFALLPSTMTERRADLDRKGIQAIWYDNEDDTHSQALEVFKDLLELLSPGYRGVRLRRASQTMGLVAWVNEDNSEALVVDTFGNVKSIRPKDVRINLEDEVGMAHALEHLKKRLSADQVWTHKEGERWLVSVSWMEMDVVVGDGRTRELAVALALWMLHPGIPETTAIFSYHYGEGGTLVKATHEQAQAAYYYFMPARSPGAIFPLGPRSRDEALSILRKFASTRDTVEQDLASGRSPADVLASFHEE